MIPYVWGVDLYDDLTVRGREADVDVGPDDPLDNVAVGYKILDIDYLAAGKPEGFIHAERPAIHVRAVADLRRIAEDGGMHVTASPTSTLVDASFHSMEELNEFAHSMGREGEYRQLGKGLVTSRWRWLHLGQFSLTSHRLNKRVHALVTPPRGCVTLAIMPRPFFMFVDGAEVGNDQVLVLDADSEVDIVSVDETECQTLTLPRSDFEASARVLFPRTHTNGGPLRTLPGPSSGGPALHGEVAGLLRNGSMSPEDVSSLLCRFLHLMAGETEKRPGEVCLGNRSASHVARLAREYIEDHYSDTIRMEDLCCHSGASLRTLQRSFRDYFQASPSEYIKARRLNSARQGLLAGAPPGGRVARIALDNGFSHLGRFSVDYREHFGESPRETLARA